MSQYNASNIDFTAIIRQMQQAEEQRREDALARYAQANTLAQNLSQQVGAMGTYGQAQQQLDMVGNAARTGIRENATQQFAQADQDLTTRGLGNTTIREAARRGTNQDALRATNQLDESLAAQRSGLLERRAGQEFQAGVNEIDTLLSRVDEAPDYGLLAGLMQQAASVPTGRQKITIGPGSSNYGALDRNRTSTAGSSSRTSYSQPRGTTSSSSGSGTTSYGGGQAGNSSQGALSGYAFGPGITSGTTATMPTGGGQPIFQLPSGAITNDPSGEGMSSTMAAGTGLISGAGGTFGIGPGDENVQDLSTGTDAVQSGASPSQPQQQGQVTMFKPGLLGFQDAKSRTFASAAEGQAAGYPYTAEKMRSMRGY